jgi:hypothetical protein
VLETAPCAAEVTPSFNPIFATASLWRPFEAHIGPLLHSLEFISDPRRLGASVSGKGCLKTAPCLLGRNAAAMGRTRVLNHAMAIFLRAAHYWRRTQPKLVNPFAPIAEALGGFRKMLEGALSSAGPTHRVDTARPK